MRSRAVFLSLLMAMLFGAAGCAMLEPVEETAPRYASSTELYNKALENYQNGKYSRAKDLFQEYIAQYPNSTIFRIALYYSGHCYQMLGEEKEALVIYNRVVATYGEDDFWGEQAFKRIGQIKGDPL
ncbi:MAG: tetratricopeptide repeat protein [Candidatus Omnitrophica bacterium]|nr:tetratricopeptide repeat protein [Candidatus Omnitrophota bacterium]